MMTDSQHPVVAHQRPSIAKYVVHIAPMLFAVALYGYSVRLPLFLDDGPQFRMVEVFTGFDQWLGSAAYFFYRPAVFSMWKLSTVLAGGFDAVGLHWLNLMLFGMTGVMLSAIAYRLLPIHRRVGALVVGIGFVIFPFSYQAVTLVGAMFHTTMIFCVVLALWCGMLWWHKPRLWLIAIGTISAFWGIFSHENGVFVALLLVALIWARYGWRALFSLRMVILATPFVLVTMLYLFAYVTVLRAPSVGGLQPLQTMLQAFSIAIQSAAYPLSALVNPLVEGVPSPWITIALGMGTLAIGMMVVLWRAVALWRIAFFGMGWYLMSVLLLVLLLDDIYVDGSPRILIFASMGLSVFYGVVFVALWMPTPNRAHWVMRPFVLVACAFVIIISLPFLQARRDHFDLLNDYMRQLHTYVRNQPPDAPLLLVNAPDYITPRDQDRTFLRGAEGAAMMFRLVDYDRQIWVNTGLLLPVTTAKFGEFNHAKPYSLYAHDPEVSLEGLQILAFQNQYLYVTHFDPDGYAFYPVYVGTPHRAGADDPIATFEDALVLHLAELVYSPQKSAVMVHLRWQVNIPTSIKPFVHVLCDGALVAQQDSHVWGGIYPFADWDVGETQTEYRRIHMPRPYDPQACSAYVGVYDQQTIARLSVIRLADGADMPDALLPIAYKGESDAPFPFD